MSPPLSSHRRSSPTVTLADLVDGEHARVGHVALEAGVLAWLEAVGIATDESIVVLRRAPFGGPLHVRTGSGGEFAICRSLARAIGIAAGVKVTVGTAVRLPEAAE